MPISTPFCDHPVHELRRRTDQTGRTFYQHQCLNCGGRVGNFVATAAALADGRQPTEFDFDFYEPGQQEINQYYRERAAAWQRETHALFAAQRLKERQEYEAYLQTDAWRAKRAEALIRDGGICQGCFQRPATQVHHLTYAHLGDELLFELISVCNDCHARIHADKASAS
jgi:hypothetical protein